MIDEHVVLVKGKSLGRCEVHEGLGILQGCGGGLFHQDVLSRLEGCLGPLEVKGRGLGYIKGVNVFPVDQLLKGGHGLQTVFVLEGFELCRGIFLGNGNDLKSLHGKGRGHESSKSYLCATDYSESDHMSLRYHLQRMDLTASTTLAASVSVMSA